MVEHWGTTANVDVVGCPVPGAFHGSRVAHEGFIVGGAGRLVEQKGFAMVADAVTQIPGATFRLAGDGPLRAELEAKGAEVDTSYTHATMAQFFTAVDVVVLFSTPTATWAEQFGRVLVEAMAQETPVIGSTCGEIPWVISTTGGGIIVEHGDREGLRRALVTLAENPMLRRQLGEAGRRAVEADFSVGAAAEGLAHLAQLKR
jgi:glycosyltransferase involved in cell wall biosynthesis